MSTSLRPYKPSCYCLVQVKVVYVKGLTEKATEEGLREVFSRFGEVSKVVLPAPKPGLTFRDFGFVHFAERPDALKALEQSNKLEVNGESGPGRAHNSAVEQYCRTLLWSSTVEQYSSLVEGLRAVIAELCAMEQRYKLEVHGVSGLVHGTLIIDPGTACWLCSGDIDGKAHRKASMCIFVHTVYCYNTMYYVLCTTTMQAM